MRAYRSPMVLRTVRSLGSAFTTFSYSVMALCSLPCWMWRSAAASTFALLNPKPKAIDSRTPSHTTARTTFQVKLAVKYHSHQRGPMLPRAPESTGTFGEARRPAVGTGFSLGSGLQRLNANRQSLSAWFYRLYLFLC